MESSDNTVRPKSGKVSFLPETEIYTHLLVLLYLIDNEKYSEVGVTLNSSSKQQTVT